MKRTVSPTAILAVILRHPRLWPEALRAARAYLPRGWWRRPPFLPLPDVEYLRWRIVTAYGELPDTVDGHDVVAFLDWRRRQRTTTRL